MTRTVFAMTTAGTNRAAALLAAAALFAALAAGCGGGSKQAATSTTTTTTTTQTTASGHALAKAAYVQKMRAIGRDLGESLNEVAAAQNTKQAAAAYRKVQAQLRLAQTEMKAITPPAAVAQEHARLTSAVGEFAHELGPIITLITHGDITAASRVPKLPGYHQLQAAAAAITAAGYKIGA